MVSSKRTALAGFLLLLAMSLAAAPPRPLPVDRSLSARGQDSRIQFIILHCTEEDWATSRRLLTEGEASSHYLVRDQPVRIYQLVPDGRRAYHAGVSSWKGLTSLNASSIGIEIVNRGVRPAPGQPPFPDYPPAQVEAVIALLKDLQARHGIRPERILAHSDIAPQRKVDPGPRFPWKRLADAGLIPWPDPARVQEALGRHRKALPDAAWFQARLASIGYAVPSSGVLDEPTRRVLAAFQMKYRPQAFDGQPDPETAALVEVMAARLQEPDSCAQTQGRPPGQGWGHPSPAPNL